MSEKNQPTCTNLAVFCVAGCMLSATMFVNRDSLFSTVAHSGSTPMAAAPVSFVQMGEDSAVAEGETMEVVETVQDGDTAEEQGEQTVVVEEVPQDTTTEVVEVVDSPAATEVEEAAPIADANTARTEVEQQTIYVDENGHQLSSAEANAITSSNEAAAPADTATFVEQQAAAESAASPAAASPAAASPAVPQQSPALQQQPAVVPQPQQQAAMQPNQQEQHLNLQALNQASQETALAAQNAAQNQDPNNPKTPEQIAQEQELAAVDARLRVPSKEESQPLNTGQLMNQVKEPVLDNDYKSILLDITKMVAQARFIMSRAFVGGQLGASSFLQQSQSTEQQQHAIAPDAEDAPAKSHTKLPARPRRVLKRDASVLDRDDPQ